MLRGSLCAIRVTFVILFIDKRSSASCGPDLATYFTDGKCIVAFKETVFRILILSVVTVLDNIPIICYRLNLYLQQPVIL